MSAKEKIIVVAMLIIVVVSWIGLYSEWKQCKEVRGVLVRGLFGMECMKSSRDMSDKGG